MPGKYRGNAAVGGVAAIAAFPAPLDLPAVCTIPAALLLVLVLPGYSLSRALFPQTDLPWLFRSILTFVLSLVTTIGTGLLVNYLPGGVRAGTWMPFLSAVTLFAVAIAAVRTPDIAEYRPRPGILLRPLDILFLLLALAGTATAFRTAQIGASQGQSQFTQLWLLPGHGNTIQVGVYSHQPAAITYRLELRAGNALVDRWIIPAMKPGSTWRKRVTVPVAKTVRAILSFRQHSRKRYRSVHILLPPGS